MNKINRLEFLKMSALGLAASMVPLNMWSMNNNLTSNNYDEELLKRLVKSNDISVDGYLEFGNKNLRTRSYRPFSEAFAVLAASYCHPDSKYYRSRAILSKLEEIITKLLQFQYPNGTLDSGGNRQSPPDTAFILEHMCAAAAVFNRQDFAEINNVSKELNKFLLNAGEGLITGGVHTPNHRWEVSSALARLYSIFHDERYIKRIDEWLAEGIYINDDGQYPERSRNYSVVVDGSLITIGRILNRPSLFEIVKKNLNATYYYMETNGDLVTLDSRRQDQNFSISISLYYLFYRHLAVYYKDETLAAVAKKIETFDDFEKFVLSQSLIFFMENSSLCAKLNTNKKLPTDYSKLFAQSGLARIRRGNITASIFGGNDKPLIIASGRSCNPNFLTFRKGSAILEYARLSTSFFNTGYFRSDGVIKDGNKYIMRKKKEAYYYQPMPENKRDINGDYKLTESLDGRFWSKMDFESRPKTTLSLETGIVIEEENGAFKIDFEVNGPKDVEVTLEFCFNRHGNLEGVIPGYEKDDYFLKDGYAKYISGNDIIEIGPGKTGHNNIRRLDGEVYSTHFGSIKGEGIHVYITGLIPFKHSVTIK